MPIGIQDDPTKRVAGAGNRLGLGGPDAGDKKNAAVPGDATALQDNAIAGLREGGTPGANNKP